MKKLLFDRMVAHKGFIAMFSMQHNKKYLAIAFSFEWSHTRVSPNHLVQHNKQYHMKVLLDSFHLNGHTLGFHP